MKKRTNILYFSRIAILSAMAIVLMLFEIVIPFVPTFYKLDFSEIPVLIGGFALGPIAGVIIEFLKIFGNLCINGTSTVFVGELANFFVGCAFVVPASIIYMKVKTKKGAIIGCLAGTLTLTIIGSLMNAIVLLPAYSILMDLPMSVLIGMGTTVNPLISNLPTFVLFAVAPFNLIKGIIVSVVVMLIYKHISFLLHNKDKDEEE